MRTDNNDALLLEKQPKTNGKEPRRRSSLQTCKSLLLVFSNFQNITYKEAQLAFCCRAVKIELKSKAVFCQLFTSAKTIGIFSCQSPRFSRFPEPKKYTMLARVRKLALLLLFCQNQLFKLQRVTKEGCNTANTIKVSLNSASQHVIGKKGVW